MHTSRNLLRPGMSKVALGLGLLVAVAAGCASNGTFNGDDWTPGSSGASGTAGSSGGTGESSGEVGSSSGGGSSGGSSSGNAAATGMPCDVQAVLNAKCSASCHLSGSSLPMQSYADLVAPSKSNPAKKMVEVSVTRMQAGTMPTGGGASAADIAAFQNWITAGLPKGTCGSADGGAPDAAANPYNTPLVCTSGNTSPPSEGTNMAPGRACGSCHGSNLFAGTVYPTAHEPNNCRGASGTTTGAKIVITGANGKTIQLPVSSGGNFIAGYNGVTLPYSVKVVVGTKERAMASKTSVGDCNTCHTANGSSGAPGRIMLP